MEFTISPKYATRLAERYRSQAEFRPPEGAKVGVYPALGDRRLDWLVGETYDEIQANYYTRTIVDELIRLTKRAGDILMSSELRAPKLSESILSAQSELDSLRQGYMLIYEKALYHGRQLIEIAISPKESVTIPQFSEISVMNEESLTRSKSDIQEVYLRLHEIRDSLAEALRISMAKCQSSLEKSMQSARSQTNSSQSEIQNHFVEFMRALQGIRIEAALAAHGRIENALTGEFVLSRLEENRQRETGAV